MHFPGDINISDILVPKGRRTLQGKLKLHVCVNWALHAGRWGGGLGSGQRWPPAILLAGLTPERGAPRTENAPSKNLFLPAKDLAFLSAPGAHFLQSLALATTCSPGWLSCGNAKLLYVLRASKL